MATNTFGNTSATSPKQQYIESLSSPTQTYNFMNESVTANPQTGEILNRTSNQPSIPTAAPVPTQSPLQAARETYLKSLKPDESLATARAAYASSFDPNPKVTDAKKKYLDFVSSAESGIANLEGQGRGIPLQIVRGQQEKLGRQSEITAKRLQGDVSLAEDESQTLRDKAKLGLDFATEDSRYGQDVAKSQLGFVEADEDKMLATAKETKAQQEANRDEIFAAGLKTPYVNKQGEIRQSADGYAFKSKADFQEKTGMSIEDAEAKGLVSVLKPTAAKPIELSEGQSLVDPVTGKVITSIPKTYAPKTGSGSGSDDDVDQYAQDVSSGILKLTSVPAKIRADVSRKVEEIKNSRYDTEFEARFDYDRELKDLADAISQGESLAAKPSEIIQMLIEDYGKYVSEQEIKATINNLLK